MANLASRTKILLWKLSVFTSGNPVGPFRIRWKYLGNQLCQLGQDLCRKAIYLSLIFGRERQNYTWTKSKLSHPFLGYDFDKEENINAIFKKKTGFQKPQQYSQWGKSGILKINMLHSNSNSATVYVWWEESLYTLVSPICKRKSYPWLYYPEHLIFSAKVSQ